MATSEAEPGEAVRFEYECRGCGRHREIELPRREAGYSTRGVRVLHRDCGTTNWAERVTTFEGGPDG